MVDIAKLSIGEKVHYQPTHYGTERFENGIVKGFPESSTDSVFVVYNCNGKWLDYKDYTGASTNARDLYLGWRHETIEVEEDNEEGA